MSREALRQDRDAVPTLNKEGWNNDDTTTVLPWILCFATFLILAWIGWIVRRHIARRCCGGDNANGKDQEPVQWQWVSTGKPPTPTPTPAPKSRGDGRSHRSRRTRNISIQSDWSRRMMSLTPVDSCENVKFMVGGDMTPCSSMTPIPSQTVISTTNLPPLQQKMSKSDFNHLLGRVCSISDSEMKEKVFALTFDIIQLGSWADDQWGTFTLKLFSLHPEGPSHIIELQQGYRKKGLQFVQVVRAMLNEWLNWKGIEKADMLDIYEALESCNKLETAQNAAINVALALRHAQGRITSECVDAFSLSGDTPPQSLDAHDRSDSMSASVDLPSFSVDFSSLPVDLPSLPEVNDIESKPNQDNNSVTTGKVCNKDDEQFFLNLDNLRFRQYSITSSNFSIRERKTSSNYGNDDTLYSSIVLVDDNSLDC